MEIKQADVLALLDLDAEAGTLRWKSGRFSGQIAGCSRADGYIGIQFGGKKYFAHRLIWLAHYGAWPTKAIDHTNGKKNDNRISNLRDVSQQTNTQNRSPNKSLKHGLMGVSSRNGCAQFSARIKVNGVSQHLGQFCTAELANKAYMTAKRKLHPSYALCSVI